MPMSISSVDLVIARTRLKEDTSQCYTMRRDEDDWKQFAKMWTRIDDISTWNNLHQCGALYVNA